jgi:hypothetical protein
MINESFDTIAVALMKDVLQSETSVKKTKYTDNEMFFNVQLDKFMFYINKNGV